MNMSPYVTAEDINASEDTRQCCNTPAMDKLKCYHTPDLLLVASIDVSRTKICLDISILATSNMDQREYNIPLRNFSKTSNKHAYIDKQMRQLTICRSLTQCESKNSV
jgi:hypothetical protein